MHRGAHDGGRTREGRRAGGSGSAAAGMARDHGCHEARVTSTHARRRRELVATTHVTATATATTTVTSSP